MREADVLLRLIRLEAGHRVMIGGAAAYRRRDGRISVTIGGELRHYRTAAAAAKAIAAGKHI